MQVMIGSGVSLAFIIGTVLTWRALALTGNFAKIIHIFAYPTIYLIVQTKSITILSLMCTQD